MLNQRFKHKQRIIPIFFLFLIFMFQNIYCQSNKDNSNYGIGIGNTYQGQGNSWRGDYNNFNGNKNKAIGNFNDIKGDKNKVIGNNNIVMGQGNFVSGKGNIVSPSGSSNDPEQVKKIQGQMQSRFANIFGNMNNIPSINMPTKLPLIPKNTQISFTSARQSNLGTLTADEIMAPIIAEQTKTANSAFQRLQELKNLNSKLPQKPPKPLINNNIPFQNQWNNQIPYNLVGNNFPFSQSFNPFTYNPYSMHSIPQIPLMNSFNGNFNPFANYQGFFMNNIYSNLPLPNFYNQPNFRNLRTNDYPPYFYNAGFRNLQNMFARK